MRRIVPIVVLVSFAAGIAWFLLAPDRTGGRGAPGISGTPETTELPVVLPGNAEDPTPDSAPARSLEPPPPPVDLDACDRDLDLFGRVVTAVGEPVPGAAIECIHYPGRRTTVLDMEDHDRAIVSASTRSAEDGTFAIRLARGDLRELRVTHPDFAEAIVPECQAGERVEVVLHPGARLVLRVIDEAGAPIGEAQGRLWRRVEYRRFGEPRRFATDVEGVAVLTSLAPGSCSIDIEHPVLGTPEVQRLELAAGETLEHEVVLPTGRTIVGTVRDRATGFPIAGARVGEGWTLDRAVLTDARGGYRLVGYSGKGGRELQAEAEGYGREQMAVPAEDAAVDFELPPGEVATGVVVGPDGEPLDGIRVHAFGMFYDATVQKTEVRSATTAADGRFRIDSLHPLLPHAVIIQAPRFGRVRRDIDPGRRADDGSIDVGTIELPAPHRLEGELVDAEGVPLPGIAVELLGDDSDVAQRNHGRDWLGFYGRQEERRTDDLGRFRFRDLAPGEYRLSASLRGQPGIEKAVTIVESDPEIVSVQLVLASGRSLRVEVLHPDGSPVEGASVSATRGRMDPGVYQRTDAQGFALLEGLRGRVRVLVSLPRGQIAPDPIEVDPRGQTERFVVTPAAFIRGIVVTEAGEPLGGMNLQCTLRRPDGVEEGEALHTEADGTFELPARPGSTVVIRCSGDRWVTEPDGSRRDAWLPRIGALHGIVAPAEGVRLELSEVAMDRTLVVRVVGPGGEPLEGLAVAAAPLWGMGPSGRAPGRTDADGRAHLEGLPATELRVHSSLPVVPPRSGGDSWWYTEWIDAIPNGQEITLSLRAGWRLTGTVVDAAGAPVARGMVTGEFSNGRDIHNPFREGVFGLVIPEGESAEIEIEGVIGDEVLTSGKQLVRGGEKDRRFVLRGE